MSGQWWVSFWFSFELSLLFFAPLSFVWIARLFRNSLDTGRLVHETRDVETYSMARVLH